MKAGCAPVLEVKDMTYEHLSWSHLCMEDVGFMVLRVGLGHNWCDFQWKHLLADWV